MSRRTRIAGAQSYRKGDLSKADLVALAKEFRSRAVREELFEQAEDMDEYAADALVYDGDLIVDGDLDTGDTDEEGEAEGTVLVVRGNLTVRGLYRDACNDAPDSILVLGDLRAEDMITAAHLEVRGSVVVSNVLIGDYNDGSAHIDGDLVARLFVPADHSFTIRGALRAEWFVKGSNELQAKTSPPAVTWRDVPFADLEFRRNDPDASELRKRLRAHQRILA